MKGKRLMVKLAIADNRSSSTKQLRNYLIVRWKENRKRRRWRTWLVHNKRRRRRRLEYGRQRATLWRITRKGIHSSLIPEWPAGWSTVLLLSICPFSKYPRNQSFQFSMHFVLSPGLWPICFLFGTVATWRPAAGWAGKGRKNTRTEVLMGILPSLFSCFSRPGLGESVCMCPRTTLTDLNWKWKWKMLFAIRIMSSSSCCCRHCDGRVLNMYWVNRKAYVNWVRNVFVLPECMEKKTYERRRSELMEVLIDDPFEARQNQLCLSR